jgi:hypothetical protein
MAFTSGGPQLEYQYLSTYHWHTTPDGYSGFIPPMHGEIVYEMERFPSERSIRLLQALGVRLVVIHTARYSGERWSETHAMLDQAGELDFVESLEADRVYRVQPRTSQPVELRISALFPARAQAGEPYTVYVMALNTGAASFAVAPTAQIAPLATWHAAAGDTAGLLSAGLPLVTSPDGGAAVIALTLTAPTEPGSYRLTIGEASGPLGAWQVEGDVDVSSAGRSEAQPFPAPVRLVDRNVPTQVQAGRVLPVRLTWRALGKIDAYYRVYVKLLDSAGSAVTGWDGQPRDGLTPTLVWVPGETVDDTVTLTVPSGTPAGGYQVEVGVYRAEDLTRVLTLDGAGAPVDHITLGTVRVGP